MRVSNVTYKAISLRHNFQDVGVNFCNSMLQWIKQTGSNLWLSQTITNPQFRITTAAFPQRTPQHGFNKNFPKHATLLTLLICLCASSAFTQLVLVNKSSTSLRLAKSRFVKAMFKTLTRAHHVGNRAVSNFGIFSRNFSTLLLAKYSIIAHVLILRLWNVTSTSLNPRFASLNSVKSEWISARNKLYNFSCLGTRCNWRVHLTFA